MNRLLIAITSFLISPLVFAGGGDLFYFGLLEDRLHSFEFDATFFNSTPIPNPDGTEFRAVPISISPGLTSFTEDPANPTPPAPLITGCLIFVEKEMPAVLWCSNSTSHPAFRGAIYVFTGKSNTTKGAAFKCISKCTGKIPRNFKLSETATGD